MEALAGLGKFARTRSLLGHMYSSLCWSEFTPLDVLCWVNSRRCQRDGSLSGIDLLRMDSFVKMDRSGWIVLLDLNCAGLLNNMDRSGWIVFIKDGYCVAFPF
jgi:hypothetical protein